MQCNYNSFINIINFHGFFPLYSEVPKNWCLSNTGALTVLYLFIILYQLFALYRC